MRMEVHASHHRAPSRDQAASEGTAHTHTQRGAERHQQGWGDTGEKLGRSWGGCSSCCCTLIVASSAASSPSASPASNSTLNCCPVVSPAGTMTLWYEPSGAATRTSSPPLMATGTVTVRRVVTAPRTAPQSGRPAITHEYTHRAPAAGRRLRRREQSSASTPSRNCNSLLSLHNYIPRLHILDTVHNTKMAGLDCRQRQHRESDCTLKSQ